MRIFICTIVFVLCFSSCKLFNRYTVHQPPSFTFLIPPYVEGPLIIIYAENCGMQPKLEDGKATFQFQNNGSVIIKDEYDMTAIIEFFLLDSIGNKTKATLIQSIDKRINNEPVLIEGGLNYTSSNVTYVNNELTKKEGGATCKWYLLQTNNTLQTFDEPTRKKLDLLTNEIVKECRSNFYAGK